MTTADLLQQELNAALANVSDTATNRAQLRNVWSYHEKEKTQHDIACAIILKSMSFVDESLVAQQANCIRLQNLIAAREDNRHSDTVELQT